MNNLSLNITEIITVTIAVYEIVSRSVRTSKTWSLIGNTLNVLKVVSDFFDNKKRK